MIRRDFLTVSVYGVAVMSAIPCNLPISVEQPIDPLSGNYFADPGARLFIKPTDLTELRLQVQARFVHDWHFEYRDEENVVYVTGRTERSA